MSYESYDARGHLGQALEGPNYLCYAYDAAERVMKVEESQESCLPGATKRTIKQYEYATANGTENWKNGKLEVATSHNFYDGPSSANDLAVQETYTYGGKGGRVSAKSTTVTPSAAPQNAGTFTQSFSWHDLGLLESQGYPQKGTVGATRTLANTFTNGFLTKVAQNATDIASSITYHPNGMIKEVTHRNGVAYSTKDVYGKDLNNMQRIASIQLKKGSTAYWSTGTYQYDGVGNVWKIGSNETFVYDKVSRLTSGTILTGGVTRTQTAQYNAFGFMTSLTTNGSTQTFTPDSAGATNRISGMSYDAAGNQLGWGTSYSYHWYPTNQMRRFEDTNPTRVNFFGYTVDGERIAHFDSVSPTGITYTIRGLDGKVLREYNESNGTWTWKKDWIYRDGVHLAVIEPTSTKHFHIDHLGTIRRITNTSGTVAVPHDYYPFGQEATNAYADTERMKFTGHERDLRSTSKTTDDLDYMHARYYHFNLGRFMSVDPVRGNPKSPQSWNLFSYVKNNPTTMVDPLGLAGKQGGKTDGGTDGKCDGGSDPDCQYPLPLQLTPWQQATISSIQIDLRYVPMDPWYVQPPWLSDARSLLAQLLFAEGASEGRLGMEAIGAVVRNRVIAPGFPNTYQTVIFQPKAFQGVGGDLWSAFGSRESLSGPNKVAAEVALAVAYDVITGRSGDPTRGALFFTSGQCVPAGWFTRTAIKGLRLWLGEIGRHDFWR